MTYTIDWDIGKEIECPHCKTTGLFVTLYTCCSEAQADWDNWIDKLLSSPPKPHIIVPVGIELPDWLSLKLSPEKND